MAAAAGVLLVLTVACGVVVVSGAEDASPAAQESPANTGTVARGKLSDMVAVSGTLTYRARSDGSQYAVINRADGTYTELPDEGDRVDCGDELYRVDQNPVLLLCGTVPAYRDLEVGDEGSDVRQLNRILHALGYDADPGDRDFTWTTEEALSELQDDKGLDVTGVLKPDDAVVLPASVRIAEVTGELGGVAKPGAAVAQATSDTLEVQVELDPSDQRAVKEGDSARITLPDNRTVKGRVERLGRVARTAGKNDNAANPTIPAYLALDQPRQARGLDEAPVQVEITTKGVESALSVPVTALVGKSGGGFAVEVVRDGGRRELVAVKLGLFDTADGRVQVEGAVREGDRVVVPSS